jgi:hypothetical protein
MLSIAQGAVGALCHPRHEEGNPHGALTLQRCCQAPAPVRGLFVSDVDQMALRRGFPGCAPAHFLGLFLFFEHRPIPILTLSPLTRWKELGNEQDLSLHLEHHHQYLDGCC